jgi:hypothetical protein
LLPSSIGEPLRTIRLRRYATESGQQPGHRSVNRGLDEVAIETERGRYAADHVRCEELHHYGDKIDSHGAPPH